MGDGETSEMETGRIPLRSYRCKPSSMPRSGQALLLSTFSLFLLCSAHQWPDQFPLQPETLGFNARYVTVSPGTQLYVVDRPGITSLPPVVLIHGLADAWRSWQLVMAQLGSDR